MSAFVVSHKHINAIVSYGTVPVYGDAARIRLNDGTTLYFDDYGDLQHAAEILLAENVRSVQERYPDTVDNLKDMPGVIAEVGEPIIFRFVNGKKPVDIIKACDCYDYQACETDDYNTTDAHRIVDNIRERAINNLPGYDEAPWEID